MIDGLDAWADQGLRVGVGLIVGALIGLERGFKLKDQPDDHRVAGVRTFSLLGLAGGISGLLGTLGQLFSAGVLLAGAICILAIAYAPRLKAKGDATSPIAAIATLGIACLAGNGLIGLALAASALVVLILALRSELHGFVDRLDKRDIQSLARFAILSLGVLPFLPNEAFGPYGAWNPFKLWWVVVLVTGFSFAGYIANRLFGARHGTVATALIGGAYSSTAVTQSLAQQLGSKEAGGAEPAGIALASAVMYLRVLVLVAVLANRMLLPLGLIVAPALVVAWSVGLWLYRSAPKSDAGIPPGNPIALLPAFTFLAFVAVAAVVARWAQEQFGEQGIALLLFLMGAMDVDTSIVTAGGLAPSAIGSTLAAIAIGGTVVANMAVKIGVTLAFARRKGIPAALALAASTAVLAGSLLLAWWRM
jgi:uncharacterized membrane protein (DUF4010 family)